MNLKTLSPEKGFLNPENKAWAEWDKAKFVIVQAPLEATVSYGGGTASGPEAIINASHQVEIWDLETKTYPGALGIATLEAVEFKKNIRKFLGRLSKQTETVRQAGKIPITLGGEHTIILGALHGIVRQRGDKPFSLLHFDAHSDLRFEYDGTIYSHACAIRQCLEAFPQINAVQVGIRALCEEEYQYIEQNPERVKTYYAHEQDSWDTQEILSHLKEDIYITFDVDGLDPTLMPATGTPEPGGLSYYQSLNFMRQALQTRALIGADFNEFAPKPELHYCDLTVARLVYKLIAYARRFA